MKYIVGILLLLITLIACEDDYRPNPVPNTRVNKIIYLDYHSELNAVGNSKYFGNIGYRGHGIIVTRTAPQKFIAFRATCPNPDDVDEDTHVELDGSFAVCPMCNAKFNILIDGSPMNEKSRYPLRSLKTSYKKSGNELRVYN